MKKIILPIFCVIISALSLRAQFTDCTSGLLQMPSAEMHEDATFTITNNYLNRHALPASGWSYDTFSYGFSVTFWKCLEVAYICTLFNGKKTDGGPVSDRQMVLFNQDRHFYGKFQILPEGAFGQDWIPAFAVGLSDPTTGSSGNGYVDMSVEGTGNGYFNRMYAALSKNFDTPWGRVAAHLAYQYNRRSDYRLNGPAAGVTWRPVWIQYRGVLDEVQLIAEYDARTVNVGLIASFWDSRFDLMAECQNFRWFNFGARFNVMLNGRNK